MLNVGIGTALVGSTRLFADWLVDIFPMNLAEAKDLAVIVSVILALVAFVKGVIEYAHQGAQKRAEHFIQMRKRLKENDKFKEIFDLLDSKDPEEAQALADFPFKDKRDLLGFYEEVALMVNSGLIRENVAHYMFGYYVIRCWDSDSFWSRAKRDNPYWALFSGFASRMKEIDLSFRRKGFRLYRRKGFQL